MQEDTRLFIVMGMRRANEGGPFAAVKMKMTLQQSSFRIHVDSQNFSLHRLKEDKQLSKATKADDADVPIYLWNEYITAPCVTEEMKNWSLKCLRRIGFKFFLKALQNDCAAYLADEYGMDWTSAARDAGGSPTKLGRDLAAIRNIILACHPYQLV